MKYLGVDYGRKKIGFAIGDDEVSVAVPLEIFKTSSREECISHIRELVQQEKIDCVIVGIPEMARAQFPEHYQEVNTFIDQLRESLSCRVIAVDESFSTRDARKRLQGMHGGDDDAVAAMLLVQSFIDRKSAGYDV